MQEAFLHALKAIICHLLTNQYRDVIAYGEPGSPEDLVSHDCLIYAYLSTVAMGLRGLELQQSAQEIQARLGDLSRLWDKVDEPFGKIRVHLANSQRQYDEARKAFDAKGLSYIPITVGETGWNVIDPRLSFRAHPVNQKMYLDRLAAWADEGKTGAGPKAVFYFEAFDEPWKGGDCPSSTISCADFTIGHRGVSQSEIPGRPGHRLERRQGSRVEALRQGL